MKHVKVISNIDKLKLCLVGHEELFAHLQEIAVQSEFPFFCGYIRIRSVERDDNGQVEAIDAMIYADGINYHYADLRLNNKYAWMTLNNKVFYDCLTSDGKDRFSMLTILESILESLNLRIHNYTWIEVCFDANVNQRKNLLSALKSDDLVPVINGKAYTKEDGKCGIKGYIKLFQGTRYGVVPNPTLYFKNADDSLVVSVYDKGKEIQDTEQKRYVREWDGIEKGTLHRIEARCKGTYIKPYCQLREIDYYEFLYGLTLPSFRLDFFHWLTDKIIYFNTVEAYGMKKQDKVSVLNTCLPTEKLTARIQGNKGVCQRWTFG